jgi:CPA1 family monovalent cation:H+ antiporter
MDESLRQAVALLAVAIIVAIAARQFRLPYTVGLVIVGAILTLTKPDFGLHLTHDLIFDLILPPLLFEAALSIPWRELRRDYFPITVLATLGTVIAACVVTAGMIWLLDWPVPSALVFGVLIAATDPVAIIAMFKDNKFKGRLCLLVESESLLNDGAATVLFVMALAWAQSAGHAQASLEMVTTLVRIVLGGVIIGAAFGGVAILVAKRTSEHLIEAALTTVAAYGSFLAAEYFDVSGVLATVTAGLTIGNLDLLSTNEKGASSSLPCGSLRLSWPILWSSSLLALMSRPCRLSPMDYEFFWLRSRSCFLVGAWSFIPSACSFIVPDGQFRCVSSTSSGGADCAARRDSRWRFPYRQHCPCVMKSWL